MLSRDYAVDLFCRALKRVDVYERMRAQVQCDAEHLSVGGTRYRWTSLRHVLIVAAGKAALPMTQAVLDALALQQHTTHKLRGVVVAGNLPDHQDKRLRYFLGGHPFPDASSRAAAEASLALLQEAKPEDLVLFLISGGASAMLEAPSPKELSVQEMASFYEVLVHSGLGIADMNCLRKRVSAVKGGRLARAAAAAAQQTLVVSDVPGGSLDVIGSGPSMPDTSTLERCRSVLVESGISQRLPAGVLRHLLASDLAAPIQAASPAFARAEFLSLTSNEDLLHAAAELASADGFIVTIDSSCDEWEYRRVADYLLHRIAMLRRTCGRVCLLSGGEVLVRLPARHGTGGRNQQFAAYCALHLPLLNLPVTVLSAGSDGLDGNSPAAGAVVDHQTGRLCEAAGVSLENAVKQFDAYGALSKVGAVVTTGPTENNVRDFRVLLSEHDPG